MKPTFHLNPLNRFGVSRIKIDNMTRAAIECIPMILLSANNRYHASHVKINFITIQQVTKTAQKTIHFE